MNLSHLDHSHWHFVLSHPCVGWPDVFCYGGGAAMIWAGFDMGGGAVITWAFLVVGAAGSVPFDFSGLGGAIVALTGLMGVVTGFVINLRKIQLEELKLGVEDTKDKIVALEEQVREANEKAITAETRAEATRIQLEKTRENFHKTTNIVTVLDAERQMRQLKDLTPDPDRSGPQKVIVMNDEGHPLPTVPVSRPPEESSGA